MTAPLQVALGQSFGNRSVIYVSHQSNRFGYQMILIQCRCLGIQEIPVKQLMGKKTTNCIKCKNPSRLYHGHNRVGQETPTHRSWRAMKERCYDPNNQAWERYGGAGITVCNRWHQYQHFLEDNGERPSAAHSLDRYPNQSGNYEPGNVRWATSQEQSRNRRSNHLITWNGQTQTIAQWAENYHIDQNLLRHRLKRGLTLFDAVQPGNAHDHLVTFRGVTKTMAAWARDMGIGYDALAKRLNRNGWTIERSLTTTRRRK